ncbi:uncharacterized protein VTP21DRAFT_2981 [Calcarisporiella thermophila]|uniref:uncharacterized protein n=1 Tax=Calcarisporiella thermophila TaxID=911321 RepID=UPI0037427976
MQYTYDEHGTTFNYFLLTILSIVLFPSTISLLVKKKDNLKEANCVCEPCRNKRTLQARLKKKSLPINAKLLLLTLGWIFFAFIAYRTSLTKIENKQWNPYEILGVSESTNPAAIKKAYRKLSLRFHPDKIQASSEKEKLAAEAKFVDITKAYKALTDEEARKNFEEFGHPDGRQAFTVGIALPSWIVRANNQPIVIGVYGLVFGLILPIFVGRWWYGSLSYGKNKILNTTMGLYFQEIKRSTNLKSLLDVLSASIEFKELIEPRPSDNHHIPVLMREIKDEVEFRGEKFEKSKRYTAPYCQKAITLIYAHLLRIEISNVELARDQVTIVEKSLHQLLGMLQAAAAQGWFTTTAQCIELSQLVVQAMHPADSPLLQLPHLTPDMLRPTKHRKRPPRTISQLATMNEAERSGLLLDLSNTEREEVTWVMQQMWAIEVSKATFKVAGETVITPNSMVTLILRLNTVNPYDHHAVPPKPSPDSKSSPQKPSSRSTKETSPPSPKTTPKLSDSTPATEDATVPESDATTPPASQGDQEVNVPEVKSEDPLRKETPHGEEKDALIETQIRKEEAKKVEQEKVDAAKEEEAEEDAVDTVDLLLAGKKSEEMDPPSEPVEAVHAPYFPGVKKPYWWVLLGDAKNDQLVAPPMKFTDIGPTPRTVRLQFQAPPRAGTFALTLLVKSDCVVGADVKKELKLQVENPSALPQDAEVEDDISEPEEDSIAGQMKLIREQGFLTAALGGSTATPHKEKEGEGEDSEDEHEEGDAIVPDIGEGSESDED